MDLGGAAMVDEASLFRFLRIAVGDGEVKRVEASRSWDWSLLEGRNSSWRSTA